MDNRRILPAAAVWLAFAAALPGVPAADDHAAARAILAARCVECHGADAQESGLRLDSRARLLAAYEPAVRIQDVAARSGRTAGGFYQWIHRMKRLLLDCIRGELRRLGEA